MLAGSDRLVHEGYPRRWLICGREASPRTRLTTLRHWRMLPMRFVETTTFTRAVRALISDEDCRALQSGILSRLVRKELQ